MLTFLQNTLGKHHKWLLSILLCVIIISFVFTIGASPGLGRKAKSRKFYGVNLSSQVETEEVMNKAFLSFMTQGGRLQSADQVQQLAMERIMLLNIADRLQLPSPNADLLSEFIATRPAFCDEKRVFDSKRYENFLKNFENNPSSKDEQLFRDALDEDFKIEKVKNVLSKIDHSLPYEIKLYISDFESSFDFDVAFVDEKKFDFSVDDLDDEALNSFYEKEKSKYEIPAKVRASYVFFDKNSYLNKVDFEENFSAVEDFLKANRNKYPSNDSENSLEEIFEQHKEKIFDDYRNAQALDLASKSAYDFTLFLYENKIPYSSEALQNLKERYSVKSYGLGPFAKGEVLDKELPVQFFSKAFELNNENYYTEPLETSAGAFVLFFDELIPSYTPPLSFVKDEVEKDCKNSIKHSMFVEKVNSLKQELENRYKNDESFSMDEFCDEFGIEKKPSKKRTLLMNFPEKIGFELYNFVKKFKPSSVAAFPDEGYLYLYLGKNVPTINLEDKKREISLIKNVSNNLFLQSFFNEMMDNGLKTSEK